MLPVRPRSLHSTRAATAESEYSNSAGHNDYNLVILCLLPVISRALSAILARALKPRCSLQCLYASLACLHPRRSRYHHLEMSTNPAVAVCSMPAIHNTLPRRFLFPPLTLPMKALPETAKSGTVIKMIRHEALGRPSNK